MSAFAGLGPVSKQLVLAVFVEIRTRVGYFVSLTLVFEGHAVVGIVRGVINHVFAEKFLVLD